MLLFSSGGSDVLPMTNRLAGLAARPLWKAFIAVAIVAVLTAIVTRAGITASLKYGRLAAPPTYDDVGYFVSAAQWLVEIHGRSSSVPSLFYFSTFLQAGHDEVKCGAFRRRRADKAAPPTKSTVAKGRLR